ncbi:Lrp/AsnC family transcriptional regulator [Candidatus Nitrososphaera evergladensis]|nr:Lrp/AsnC family transcriptional regulator [Candidatus Nitrososphaera evergladensis]
MIGDPANKLEASSSSISRQEIVVELERRGINASLFGELSIDQLGDMLRAITRIIIANGPGKKRQISSHSGGRKNLALSSLDKKILRGLLSSKGKVSSITLSKETGAPLSTVQRRRKRLEANFLETSYLPRVKSLGWRVAMVFVSTQGGTAIEVGKELLSWKKAVIRVSRATGLETTDIAAEVIFYENEDLLNIIERVRAITGVRNLFWVEVIDTLGKNNQCFEFILDKL